MAIFTLEVVLTRTEIEKRLSEINMLRQGRLYAICNRLVGYYATHTQLTNYCIILTNRRILMLQTCKMETLNQDTTWRIED